MLLDVFNIWLNQEFKQPKTKVQKVQVEDIQICNDGVKDIQISNDGVTTAIISNE